MKKHHFISPASLLLMALVSGTLLVSGCGGPPANNPFVAESRVLYDAAALNADLVSEAPETLKAAELDLLRSEKLLAEGGKTEVIEHYAYLAKQNVAIAQETTRLNMAEESIEEATAERRAVQLQARTAEAEASKREAAREAAGAKAANALAERSADAAKLAQKQTADALARAQELADRIAELEAEQTNRGLVLTLGDVLFDVGKADMKAAGRRAIEELAVFLQEYEDRNVLIEGFTDNTGSESLNQELSSKRSAAVKAALVSKGIMGTRIQTTGYGEAYPRASNGTSAGRQHNRRVEIVISDESGVIPRRLN